MGIMPITGIPLPVHELRRLQHPHRLHRHGPRPQRPHAPLQLTDPARLGARRPRIGAPRAPNLRPPSMLGAAEPRFGALHAPNLGSAALQRSRAVIRRTHRGSLTSWCQVNRSVRNPAAAASASRRRSRSKSSSRVCHARPSASITSASSVMRPSTRYGPGQRPGKGASHAIGGSRAPRAPSRELALERWSHSVQLLPRTGAGRPQRPQVAASSRRELAVSIANGLEYPVILIDHRSERRSQPTSRSTTWARSTKS